MQIVEKRLFMFEWFKKLSTIRKIINIVLLAVLLLFIIGIFFTDPDSDPDKKEETTFIVETERFFI